MGGGGCHCKICLPGHRLGPYGRYMKDKNPYRPFTPNPEMMALRPDVAGSTINGLGEDTPRRPSLVFWSTDPDTAPWGQVQKWFYKQEKPNAEMLALRARRKELFAQPLPDIAPEPVAKSPDDWTKGLDQFIDAGDCEMVGVADMRPEWVYDHRETDLPRVVILGVQHVYDDLKHVPETRGGADVTLQYGRAAEAAVKVAGWIREQGYDADPVTGPMVGQILLIPPALECGFGELGKHGSLINPEFGSGFRLSGILTNAPFATTPKREFGIDDFCANCRVCENACPPFAIAPDKQMVRGVEKWYVDFDKCIPFFAQTSGCAICIAACPWTRPGVGFNLAEKLARRSERLADEKDAEQ